MITSHQGGNSSFLNFPIRALLRTMRHLVREGGGGGGGGGGELAKEVAFAFMFLLLF